MNAKCGTCGKKHDTIAEYRDCAGVAEEAAEAQDVMNRLEGSPTHSNPPSDRQVAYVADLLLIHEWPDEVSEEDLRAMERSQVSSLISAILRRPLKRQVPEGQPADGKSPRPQSFPGIPAGRYAIIADGKVKFYRVDKPTEGRWAGRTFVKVQASDDLHPVKDGAKVAVLAEIAKDPKAAMLRYGHEIGACGLCGRTLTDEESRGLGIGPVCRNKMGW